VSVISGNLPDDSSYREEHPLEDADLVADWDGAPEQTPATQTVAESDTPETQTPAEDILEEELIDEREALRAQDEDPFAEDDEEDLR
ncbi:MAG: cell division ATP-binding protein FtsE, partial [Brachybacterium sp.]